MGPSGRIGHILYILDCLGQVYACLYLGRAPRTKETLPDFLKWRRVTRPPLVFRGLTGSQRNPGFWGVTAQLVVRVLLISICPFGLGFELSRRRKKRAWDMPL